MDVKRMSKNIANKIQQNLKPISDHLLPLRKTKIQNQRKNSMQMPNSLKSIDIEHAYKTLKQNAVLDNKSNVKVVTCLKAARKVWDDYLNSSNKNGQLACSFQMKLKTIDQKYQQQLSKLIVQGSLQKMQQCSQVLKPMIEHLQKKSKKFRQHQSEFKVISRKVQQKQNQNEQHEDQIKQQMLDLVQKFKKYVINIQQNLTNDTTVIKQIGQSQDKHLDSLTNKNNSMTQIIKQQKLGFFQLIGMGIMAIVAWIIGLMIIIIV